MIDVRKMKLFSHNNNNNDSNNNNKNSDNNNNNNNNNISEGYEDEINRERNEKASRSIDEQFLLLKNKLDNRRSFGLLLLFLFSSSIQVYLGCCYCCYC